MHASIPALLCSAALLVQADATAPALPGVGQLMDVCSSATVAEGAARGSRLGWQRQDDAGVENWRSNLVRSIGGTVAVVVWRRGVEDGEGVLAFWVARGRDAHRACAYSVTGATGLLAALSEHLGTPGSVEENGSIVSAAWASGPTEIQFSRVGASAAVYVTHHDR